MQCDVKTSKLMISDDRECLHVIQFALTDTAQSGEPNLQPGSTLALVSSLKSAAVYLQARLQFAQPSHHLWQLYCICKQSCQWKRQEPVPSNQAFVQGCRGGLKVTYNSSR